MKIHSKNSKNQINVDAKYLISTLGEVFLGGHTKLYTYILGKILMWDFRKLSIECKVKIQYLNILLFWNFSTKKAYLTLWNNFLVDFFVIWHWKLPIFFDFLRLYSPIILLTIMLFYFWGCENPSLTSIAELGGVSTPNSRNFKISKIYHLTIIPKHFKLLILTL